MSLLYKFEDVILSAEKDLCITNQIHKFFARYAHSE